VTFEIVRSTVRAQGLILDLLDVELRSPDGRTAHRDVVRHGGGVGILPIDGEDVVLISQYRAAVGGPLLEIPAGKLDSAEEPPEEAAGRELEEEIGMTPGRLIDLFPMFPSPGYTSEVIHLYAAADLRPVERRPDGVEEDHAHIVRVGLDDAIARARSGQLEDAKTRLALLLWSVLRDDQG